MFILKYIFLNANLKDSMEPQKNDMHPDCEKETKKNYKDLVN